MKKFSEYNFLLLVVGFIFAEGWRRLLKSIYIPEFFKWVMDIGMIIIVFFIINKIVSLVKND